MTRLTPRRRPVHAFFAAAIALALAPPTESAAQGQALQPRLEGQELVRELVKGGHVILMRHMSTDDYVPDDGAHVNAECMTQRNLDARGEREAKALGVAFKTLAIPVGPVLSSPYCRCVETGMLAFGGVLQDEALAVFDALPGAEKDARGKRIRHMLNQPPPPGENTILITHTGSLLYTFGLQTQPEGIAHVFRPAEFGQSIYLGRVIPAEWTALAERGQLGGADAVPAGAQLR